MLVFTKNFTASIDGVNTKEYKKGDTYDGAGAQAKRVIEHLKAQGILEEKKIEEPKKVKK